ncbi:MAG: diguanylate cyclase [Gammaproteobacteria bacterium]|nr:diguanylate cyclase [Gammaproteobacteria bacterium]
MQLDHINIAAPAELLEKVRDFYCDVLGLTEGFRPDFSRDGYWLYSEDKAIIHLIVSSRHHENKKQGYFDHFALRTTGMAKVLEQLHAFSIEYRTSHLPEINLTQIFCKDPSGTGVEINFLNEPL